MKPKNIKLIISILLIIIVILLVIYQFGFFSGKQIEPGRIANKKKEVNRNTFTVKEVEIPEFYKTIGSIHSRNETEISSRLTAKIFQLDVRNGDKVVKGQILAVLENNELKSAVAEAEKNVESINAKIAVSHEAISAAGAEFSAASEDYTRSVKLSKSGNISIKLLEQAESRYKQADAAAKQARLNLTRAIAEKEAAQSAMNQASTMLSYSIIKSPIDGVISEQLIETGDIAIPGKILFKIFNPKTLMLEMPVKESLISKIKISDKVIFFIKALNKNYEGTVKEIVPYIDSETRTFLVKVCIGEDYKLVPGMYGKAEIQVGNKKALIIPDSSIKQIGQTETAMLITDGKPRKIFIRTIEGNNKKSRIVLSGLKAGDKIIRDYKFK